MSVSENGEIRYIVIKYGKSFLAKLMQSEAQRGTGVKRSDIRESVTVQEVDNIMTDELAASLVEESESITDKTKQEHN